MYDDSKFTFSLTIDFTENAAADLNKIKTLGDFADMGEVISRSLGTQLTLMKYIAKGYEVQLHKRGRRAKVLDLSND